MNAWNWIKVVLCDENEGFQTDLFLIIIFWTLRIIN